MNMSRIGILAIALVAIGCSSKDENGSNNAPSPGTQPAPSADSNNAPPTPDSNSASTLEGNSASGKTETPSVPKPPPIVQTGQGGWTAPPKPPTATKAEEKMLAFDRALKGLKNAKFLVSSETNVSGGFGTNNTQCVIADQKDRYLLQYAFWLEKERRFETQTVAKIKGKIQTFVNGEYKPGRIKPSDDILKFWATDHSHYMANAIASDAKPFSSLLAKAKAAGWKVTLETKRFDRGTYERLVLESPKKDTKYEIMFEPLRNLPVTIQTNIERGKPTRIKSLVSWAMSDTPLKDEDIAPSVKTPAIKEPDLDRKIPEGNNQPGT